VSKKLIRQLKGTGTVYRGDAVIEQSAQYRIDIHQQFLPSGIGASEIPGMISLSGVIEGNIPVSGERLRLATAQFFFEFWVSNSNVMVGVGFTDLQGNPIGIENL
jgi:hypothetical protein